MRTVTIPSSSDAAEQRLNELDQEISNLSWEKAVIVSAYVGEGGQKTSPQAFASKGIQGLDNTADVLHYAETGKQVSGQAKPGQSVTLPDQSFHTTQSGGQSSRLSS